MATPLPPSRDPAGSAGATGASGAAALPGIPPRARPSHLGRPLAASGMFRGRRARQQTLLVGEGPTFLGGVLRRAVVAVIGEPIARAGSPAQTASAPPQGRDAVAPDGRAGLYRER